MATSKNVLGVLVCGFFILSLGLVIYVEKASGTPKCHSKQIFSKKANCSNTPSFIGNIDLINRLSRGQLRDSSFVEALLNGKGTYVFFDGQSYTGELKNNSFEGEGNLIFPDGTRYEGKFKQGQYHGQGTLYAEDGDVLVNGKWDSGNLIVATTELEEAGAISECRSGNPDTWDACYGKILEDGYTYSGQWEDGMHGVIFHTGGDVYTGSVRNRNMHGHGVFVLRNGR